MAGPWEDFQSETSSATTRAKAQPPGPWDEFALPANTGPTNTTSLVSPSPVRAESGSVAQPTFSDPMTGFTVGDASPAPAAPAPAAGPEMRAWEPTLWERFTNMIPGNNAKAANEYAARQIAKEKGISVDQVYRDAGGSRPIFNPEGRAPVQAGIEAGKVIASEVPDIPRAAVNTTLRTIRGGNIQGAQDQGLLDRAITATNREQPKGPIDRNYDAFRGAGDSLGFSLTTMVSSILAGSGATAATGGNVPVGVATGMATSGTIAYRASKDDFLSRVRDQLNDKAKKLYGRELTNEEWNQARQDFDGAATEYGAWEAIPEAVSNTIFLKAFSAPAKALKGSRLTALTEKAGALASEQVTETVTALGQNAAELKVGLTQDELNIADAFRQQFVQTLVVSGGMAGGLKGKELATKFYQEQVEPRVSPGSALARAIKADLEATGFTPEGVRQEAVNRLNPDNAQLAEVQRPQTNEGPWTLYAKPQQQQVQDGPWTEFKGSATISEPPITVQAGPGFNASNVTGMLPVQGEQPVAPAAPEPAPAEPVAAEPAPVEPPKPERPDTVAIFNGLIDVMNGGYMGQKQAMKEWQLAHGLVEVKDNEPVLSSRGQQLIQQLNPTGVGAKSLTTQEADELINQFVAANPPKPVEPVTIAPVQPAPAPEPVVAAVPQGNEDETGGLDPQVIEQLKRIERLANMAEAQLNGQPVSMEGLIRTYKKMVGEQPDNGANILANTEKNMAKQAKDKMWSKMLTDYMDQFGESPKSEQQVLTAIKNGSFDISGKDYAAGAYEVYKIDPAKIKRAERKVGVDDDVSQQLQRFEAGVFSHRGGVAGTGAQGAEVAKAANERYTQVYVQAAKQFLEGPLTAKVPSKKGDSLDIEFLEDVNPQPIEKKINSAKPATTFDAQFKALDSIAAKEDIRYYLKGIMLDRDKNRMVATDGHRVAVISAPNFDGAPAADKASNILGRDGKWIDGRFPDIDRVVPTQHYAQAFQFNATELGNQARGIAKAWKYVGTTMPAPMGIQTGDTTTYFSAPYIADMADLFRRMGYDTFELSLNPKGEQLYARSPDGKVQQVIMGLRRGDSIFRVAVGQELGPQASQATPPARKKARAPKQTEAQFEQLTIGGQAEPARARVQAPMTEELDNGAATDQPGRPAAGATEGGADLAQGGQGDEGLGVAGSGTASPSPNTRGTRVGQFVQRVSFTNRESFYREAFRAAGYDPAVANNLPIERQFNILAKLLESTFGLKFVDKTPRASSRKAVDELLDLYRNLQFMMASLELPLKTIGLDGSLGIVSMEKQPYFAVYYPQGLVLNGRPTKAMPQGKEFTGPFVGLPNRTNSFAHEWGHALDFWLQDQIGKNHKGGVSGAIRDIGMSDNPSNSERAFVDLINALFFDQAKIAARVMELERKIATTQSDDVRAKLQAQLDAIKAGNSMVSDRSDYYRKVQQLGNDAYYLKPTEMIARSFETFISHKVEGIGGGTEAITKGLSAYNNDSVEYMQNAYPQQAERDKINLAWENLIDALRAEAILGKPGDQVAQVPGNMDIIDPNEMLRLSPENRSLMQREVDAWAAFRAEGRRNDRLPKNPQTPLQRYQNTMSSLFWSERGTLLTLTARYPRSNAIREVTRRLTTDPGSSRLNNRLTFEEAVDRQVKRFSVKVGEIIKRHELDKLEPEQMESLRRLLVSQPDGKATPEVVAAADKIRNLFNEAWYYGDNSGLKMGYAQNAYLPRMMDMAKIDTDMDGFAKAAAKVYEKMFDDQYENYDTDAEALVGLLTRGLKIAKQQTRGRMPPRATGLETDELEALNKAVKQYKAAAAAAKKAAQEQDDPDAALAKAEEEMAKAIELAGEVYDAIRRADGQIRAATWLENMVVGGNIAQIPGASPDADFMQGRVLPAEADVLLKDYLVSDVIALMMDYMPKLVRRAEYEKRFGGTRMDDLKRQMYAEGVYREDIDMVEHIVAKLSGAVYDNSMGTAVKAVQTVQALGIMAMLGRAVLSSVAEPLGAAVQTRNVADAWRSMTASIGAFLPTATAREREELAAAIGLIGNPYMDQMLSNREGGQFQDDPKLSKRMAKYYLFTLQHQWVSKTSTGAMVVSQGFVRERMRTFMDSKNAAERDRAMRDLKELGLQPNDVAQFMQWMNEVDENGESIMSGRKVVLDDLNSDMGEVYSEMVYRMSRKIILDPKPTDTAAFSKTTLGRAVMSIQSFAYTFQRQFLIASYKKIQEEYKSSGSISETTKVAGAVALGFASLVAGQIAISALREMIFNPDRWDEMEKKGDLGWYLLKMGISRAGLYGAWDPIYNLAEGIKYQRDLATTAVGAVPGYFFQALQRIITPFVRNREKTNTAEYNAVIGAYELAGIPMMAWGMTMLPAGPLTAPVMAALYATVTSPKAKNDIAETVVGPKDNKGRAKKQELTNY